MSNMYAWPPLPWATPWVEIPWFGAVEALPPSTAAKQMGLIYRSTDSLSTGADSCSPLVTAKDMLIGFREVRDEEIPTAVVGGYRERCGSGWPMRAVERSEVEYCGIAPCSQRQMIGSVTPEWQDSALVVARTTRHNFAKPLKTFIV